MCLAALASWDRRCVWQVFAPWGRRCVWQCLHLGTNYETSRWKSSSHTRHPSTLEDIRDNRTSSASPFPHATLEEELSQPFHGRVVHGHHKLFECCQIGIRSSNSRQWLPNIRGPQPHHELNIQEIVSRSICLEVLGIVEPPSLLAGLLM